MVELWDYKRAVRSIRDAALHGKAEEVDLEQLTKSEVQQQYLVLRMAGMTRDMEKIREIALKHDSVWLRHLAGREYAKSASEAERLAFMELCTRRQARWIVRKYKKDCYQQTYERIYPEDRTWVFRSKESLTPELIHKQMSETPTCLRHQTAMRLLFLNHETLIDTMIAAPKDTEWVTSVLRDVVSHLKSHRVATRKPDIKRQAELFLRSVDPDLECVDLDELPVGVARYLLDNELVKTHTDIAPLTAEQFIKWLKSGRFEKVHLWCLPRYKFKKRLEQAKVYESLLDWSLKSDGTDCSTFEDAADCLGIEFFYGVMSPEKRQKLVDFYFSHNRPLDLCTVSKYALYRFAGDMKMALKVIVEKANSSDPSYRAGAYRAAVQYLIDLFFPTKSPAPIEGVDLTEPVDILTDERMDEGIRKVFKKVLEFGHHDHSFTVNPVLEPIAPLLASGRFSHNTCYLFLELLRKWTESQPDIFNFLTYHHKYIEYAQNRAYAEGTTPEERDRLLTSVEGIVVNILNKPLGDSHRDKLVCLRQDIFERIVLRVNRTEWYITCLERLPPKLFASSFKVWSSWRDKQNLFPAIRDWNRISAIIHEANRIKATAVIAEIEFMFKNSDCHVQCDIDCRPLLPFVTVEAIASNQVCRWLSNLKPHEMDFNGFHHELMPYVSQSTVITAPHLSYLRRWVHVRDLESFALQLDSEFERQLLFRNNDSIAVQEKAFEDILHNLKECGELTKEGVITMCSIVQQSDRHALQRILYEVDGIITKPPSISKNFLRCLISIRPVQLLDVLIKHLTTPGVHHHTRYVALRELGEFVREPKLWDALLNKIAFHQSRGCRDDDEGGENMEKKWWWPAGVHLRWDEKSLIANVLCKPYSLQPQVFQVLAKLGEIDNMVPEIVRKTRDLPKDEFKFLVPLLKKGCELEHCDEEVEDIQSEENNSSRENSDNESWHGEYFSSESVECYAKAAVYLASSYGPEETAYGEAKIREYCSTNRFDSRRKREYIKHVVDALPDFTYNPLTKFLTELLVPNYVEEHLDLIAKLPRKCAPEDDLALPLLRQILLGMSVKNRVLLTMQMKKVFGTYRKVFPEPERLLTILPDTDEVTQACLEVLAFCFAKNRTKKLKKLNAFTKVQS